MPTKPIRKRSFTKGPGASGGGALLGYARVSKGDEQNNALQTKALRAAGCRRLFEETGVRRALAGFTHERGAGCRGSRMRSLW